MASLIKTFFEPTWFKGLILLVFAAVLTQKDLQVHFDLVGNGTLPPPATVPHEDPTLEQEDITPKITERGETLDGQIAQGTKPKASGESESEPIVPNPSTETQTFSFNPASIGKEGSGTKPSKKKNPELMVSEETKRAYIKRFSSVAKKEMDKYGIPASITIGQALLESKAGRTESAHMGNNHFSLPCSSSWKGKSAEYQGTCYRQYDSAWGSFRDHSKYVTSGKFSRFKKYGKRDYKRWARGLEAKKYSNERNYAKKLIEVIEEYGLTKYDK